ncbi:hypothetical protein [Pseudomonas sp. MUP55]|uniref:hypothetical protein n=1 Tax=Pseudomonas sp. MUP55 TaxID=3087234 RepID=UPI002A5AA39E|nr:MULTISPECIES: hypothetical protein [unclassified Pseudomonas]WPN92815.1 hypothetical protein SC319_00085 [Pseudomonas sp. MUP56]WPN98341.1 hypothetical protein SC318_00085 [Pseudomonas sp. MUP55]
MLKIILNCIMYLCATYCIGDKIRRNPKIDAFLTTIEGSYTRINEHLENATVRSGLELLRKIYGWACLAMFGLFLVVIRLFPEKSGAVLSFSQLFMLTFLFWFSIKWAVDHKATLTQHWKTHSLMVSGPILMGLLDTLLDTPFTQALVLPLKQLPGTWYSTVASFHPLIIGALYSSLCFASFLVYYMMTWIITTPMLILSVVTIIIPIQFARLLAIIDRENTFLWLAVFTGAVCMIWLTQL